MSLDARAGGLEAAKAAEKAEAERQRTEKRATEERNRLGESPSLHVLRRGAAGWWQQLTWIH